MSETTEIQYNLTLNTEMTYNELRKLEIILMRCLSYASRLTGDENLKRGIQVLQQAITTLRTLQLTMRAVQMASGPIGWAYAATSLVGVGFSGYSMYETIVGVSSGS
jgi:hypothetical protein